MLISYVHAHAPAIIIQNYTQKFKLCAKETSIDNSGYEKYSKMHDVLKQGLTLFTGESNTNPSS